MSLVDMSGLEPTRQRYAQPKRNDPSAKPIDYLVPGSKEHIRVRDYLTARIDFSERNMGKFYDRWRYNEQRVQAYIDLNDYERLLKEQNDAGKPARVVNITVPYMYATIMTIVTYMIHTFCGRKPIFQVAGLSSEAMEKAPNMEMVLQYNADHTRLIRHIYQWLLDQEIYGVGVMLNMWSKQSAKRTVWTQNPGAMPGQVGLWTPTKKQRTIYEGNIVRTIDPFMFFPDCRVPMSEVAERGEFCFWRTFESKHMLKRAEAQGVIRFIDAAGQMPRGSTAGEYNKSNRSIRSGGESVPADERGLGRSISTTFVQVDQGVCHIVPKELGLSESTYPEPWLFTILNKQQIVQAEPYEADHGRIPIAVAEPYTFGYGFGQLGSADFIGPYQDTISWFVNSHIENVRTVLNNMLVVDPSRVEMQDLRNPDAGKLIRVKRASYGQDVREMVHQLQVSDVTQNHVRDLEMFIRMADSLVGVNDNLRGLQDSGGRKTATEVRTSGEAGASRLASSARLRSAQGLVDLVEMMSLNIQQYMSEEFYLTLMGSDAQEKPIRISPEHLTGDFYFPIHDGTLPQDKIAQLDIWKEIFLTVAQNEGLAQQYSVPAIFDWVAELGGAKNLSRFKVQVAPDAAAAQQAQQGNLVPTTEVKPSGQVNALEPNPGRRAAL